MIVFHHMTSWKALSFNSKTLHFDWYISIFTGPCKNGAHPKKDVNDRPKVCPQEGSVECGSGYTCDNTAPPGETAMLHCCPVDIDIGTGMIRK